MTTPPADRPPAARALVTRALGRYRRMVGTAPPEPSYPSQAEGAPPDDRSRRASALVTRTEAARALAYFDAAGVRTVIVDAAPDDATATVCRAANGWTYSLSAAHGLLPHTTDGAACRCRLRAAHASRTSNAPEPPRPADAVWGY